MSDDRPAISVVARTVVVVARIVSPPDPDQFVAHFKEGPDQYKITQRTTREKAVGMLAQHFPEGFGLNPEARYLKGEAQHVGEMLLANLDLHNIEIEDRTVELRPEQAKEGE